VTAKPAQALPKELLKLRALLQRGLDETASLWPDIACAFGWVQQAARVLENPANQSAEQVHRRYRGLLGAMRRWRSRAGALAPAVDHFLKVSRSYWPGLFHCYDVEDLPRTNNDLEHVFGAFRYHERRASGRQGAAASLVVRGCARLVAAVATRQRACPFCADDLAQCDLHAWRALRVSLDRRQHAQVCQRRFRRNSATYLAELETRLVKLILPP
jgi:hypothetical protein